MTVATGAACGQCQQPVTAEFDPAGNLTYVHAGPAGDGHKAELPPVTVTYKHEGIWTDVSCDELGGLLGTVTGQDTARSLAWTCLRRLQPPRTVREQHEHSGG